jgi:hypothetical protein
LRRSAPATSGNLRPTWSIGDKSRSKRSIAPVEVAVSDEACREERRNSEGQASSSPALEEELLPGRIYEQQSLCQKIHCDIGKLITASIDRPGHFAPRGRLWRSKARFNKENAADLLIKTRLLRLQASQCPVAKADESH